MAPAPLAHCAGIEVFKWRKGTSEWETSWIHHSVSATSNQPSGEEAGIYDVTISVSGHEDILKRCHWCTKYLNASFEFLPTWWETTYLESNGYFGYQDDFDRDGIISSVNTWSRFLVQHFIFQNMGERIIRHWRDIIVFTNWLRASQKTNILFIRADVPAVNRLVPLILQNLKRSPPNDPLWPYVLIMNYYLNLQHKATYAIRELTESEENTAGQRVEHVRRLKTNTDYARLHEVARHTITVSEILGVNVKTLDHILKYHTDFIEHSPRESRLDIALRRTHQRLLLYAHMAYSMHCRCISYRDRMKNEIQRAFNVVSQDDARASVEIAKATKADSQAMKATSFIALVFLPPTYISAVFSTTFFDYGADSRSWGVSEKMWIYWAFVVPATLVSVGIWYFRIFRDH